MSQHDYIISDQDGLSFLADLNDSISAIVSNNSGATAPADTYAYMYWVDTTSGILKQRNAANDGWVSLITLSTGDPAGLGSTLQPYDATALNAADIGSTVQGYDADIPTVSASQAEMEAGTLTDLRSMSPLNIAQAIAALGNSAGSWELIETWTPTAVSLKDFSWDESLYTKINIVIEDVSPSLGDSLFMRLGYNNASSILTTQYNWDVQGISGSSTSDSSLSNATGLKISTLGAGVSTTTGDSISADITLKGIGSIRSHPFYEFSASYTDTGSTEWVLSGTGRCYSSSAKTNQIDTVRLYWDSGNSFDATGTISIYGLKR